MSIFDLILSEDDQRRQEERRALDFKARNALAPLMTNDDSAEFAAASRIAGKYANRNLGWREKDPTEERYQFWPEKMIRSGVTASRDAWTGDLPMIDPETGHTSMAAIERAQDLTGMIAGGSMPAMARMGSSVLGAAGGKMVQPETSRYLIPAVKHEGKVYKGEIGNSHPELVERHVGKDATYDIMDADAGVGPTQFGYMNHKGQFLSREKAGRYAYNNNLIGDEALASEVKEFPGIFNSDMLLADSGNVAAPLSALAKPQSGGFYSAVEHAIVNAKQDKMTPDQWAGWLKNQPGVKGEELNWLGITDQLPQELKGPVTKDQMLQYARQHGPEIKEIEKGGKSYDDRYAELLDQGHHVETAMEQALKETGGDSGATKFSDYQLPGGENYRELLLTMPEKGKTRLQELKRKADEGELSDAEFSEMNKLHNDPSVFRSSHWDEPNVLAHVRMNDRQIPDVGKALHLEEIQSDWHQAGRKEGYTGTKDWAAENLGPTYGGGGSADMPMWRVKRANGDEIGTTRAASAEEAILSLGKTSSGGVPDAPFKSTWADLALKRSIAKAIEGGYDAISWTPGKQQAERYDLSKQIDTLKVKRSVDPKGETYYSLSSIKNGPGYTETIPLGHDTIRGHQLADVVGKDLAEKIKSQNSDIKDYSGLDLQVGGEGMKGFYDKMLVDKANALAKKFGSKVEYQHLPQPVEYFTQPAMTPQGEKGFMIIRSTAAGDEGVKVVANKAEADAFIKEQPTDLGVKVPVLRIPQQMREHVSQKGQPLFMSGVPNFQFTPVDHNPFENKE